jgi:hypothetical protein
LTLGATDLLCVATLGFRGTALRATGFFGARFVASFLLTVFLTAAFLVVFVREETFTFPILRDTIFRATALFAFGRDVWGVVVRRFATDFGDDRRAAARDVERLRPLVTALILLKVERAYVASSTPEVAVAE